MQYRCLIIDDEPLAVELVASYCARVPQLEVVGTCSSAIEASPLIKQRNVDLLFLDIKMPQMLGIEFLRSLLNPPKVIFVTAYREFGYDGFELDVVDYLLKPLSFGRFMKSIHKLERLMPSLIEESLDKESEPFLYFRMNRENIKVFLNDLLFVESNREYSKLVLQNGKSILIRESISSLEEKLNNHRFIRVHRSFLVASDKITTFSSNQVRVADSVLPIGRLYKNNVDHLKSRWKK